MSEAELRTKIDNIDAVILAIIDYSNLAEGSPEARRNLLRLINTHKPITRPKYTLDDILHHTLDGLRAEFQDYRNLLSTRLAAAIGPAATAEAGYAASGPVAASRYAAASGFAAAARGFAAASGPVASAAAVADYMPVYTIVVSGHGAVQTIEPPGHIHTGTNTASRHSIKVEQLPFSENQGEYPLDSVVYVTALPGCVLSMGDGAMVTRIFQDVANYENVTNTSKTDKLKELFPPLDVRDESISGAAVDPDATSRIYSGRPVFVSVEGETPEETLGFLDNETNQARGIRKGDMLSEVCATGVFPDQITRSTVLGVTYPQAFNISVYTPGRITGARLGNSYDPWALKWTIWGPNPLTDIPESSQYLGVRPGSSYEYDRIDKIVDSPEGKEIYMPSGQSVREHIQQIMTMITGSRARIRIIILGCGAYNLESRQTVSGMIGLSALHDRAFRILTCSSRLNITTYNTQQLVLLYNLLMKEIGARIAGGKRKRRRINGRRTKRKRDANKRTHTRRR